VWRRLLASNGALDAGHFAGRLFEELHLEALPLAVARVHPLEYLRPVLRLGPAGAGLDIEKAIGRVHRTGEHAAEFHVRHGAFQRARIAFDGNQGRVVAFVLGDLEQLARIAQPRREPVERSDE
jgi:hypothetical protein